LNTTTQVRIASVQSTIGYNLLNTSIESVRQISAPQSVQIQANDLFIVFDTLLLVPLTDPTGVHATLVDYLASDVLTYSVRGIASFTEYNSLRGLLASSLFFVNSAVLNTSSSGGFLYDSRSGEGYFANITSRVTIPAFSFYTFTILGSLTLLWCVTISTIYTVSKHITPNSTLFPEIDIASKAVYSPDIKTLLAGRGNASTGDIVKEIKGKRIFAGKTVIEGQEERVLLGTRYGLGQLSAGNIYC